MLNQYQIETGNDRPPSSSSSLHSYNEMRLRRQSRQEAPASIGGIRQVVRARYPVFGNVWFLPERGQISDKPTLIPRE